jgi:hypothetical protein
MDDDAPAAVFLGAWDRGSANRRSQCQRDIEDERHHVTSTRLSWLQMRCHCPRLFVFLEWKPERCSEGIVRGSLQTSRASERMTEGTSIRQAL